jgi:23S rRNA (adenine2030-N6)-methyltransferase
MFSYQHIYHAGNGADLQKHLWLLTVLEYLTRKDKPIFWVDTHAGRGLYDLNAPEAVKTPEFKGTLLPVHAALSGAPDLPGPLALYFQLIAKLNEGPAIRYYPGSALLAAKLLRPTDRLLAFDLHKGEFSHLFEALAPYPYAQTRCQDGLKKLLPPLPPEERRGGALIDPSYELKSEYGLVLEMVTKALKSWPEGTYMIWYPLLPAQFHIELREGAQALAAKIGVELITDEWVWGQISPTGRGMSGSGMLVFNPPYTCAETMQAIKPLVEPLLRRA